MVAKLVALPKNDDEYWEHADTQLIDIKDVSECKHYMVRMSGTEVECRECHLGFFVGPRDRVKNGHLYLNGKKVI